MKFKRSKKPKKIKENNGRNSSRPKLLKKFAWRNVSIGRKYITVFFFTLLLFVASACVVFFLLTKGQEDIKEIEKSSSRVNDMADMAYLIQAKDVQIADYLLTESEKYQEQFIQYQEEFLALAEKLKPSMETDEQRTNFNAIVSNNESTDRAFTEQIVPAVEEGQSIMANSLRDYTSRLRTETIEHVNELITLINDDQNKSVQNAKSSIQGSAITLAIATILAAIIGIPLMIIISRIITKHLKKIVGVTSEVANGNLRTSDMDYEGTDEIGQLAAAVNKMKGNIHSILMKVADASNSVSSRSEVLTQSSKEVSEGNTQIATTMEELSTGAETQANSASDLSENMNDFVQKVELSEQNGQEAAQNSTKVLDLTNEGTALMNKSVAQMKQIDTIVSTSVDKVQGLDKQSNEISKLVLVIKDIADQTNLLSLNAAIEAARAGEHGRGFAVVADEVGKLSEQVASSVGEITNIVQRIQSETTEVVGSLSDGYKEVQEGTKQIEETGRNFNSINASVSEMANKITFISSNLREISQNSKEMNNLIEEIASVSEESAAGVEQAAASAQQTSSSMEEVSYSADELAKLAEQLNQELKVFKLK
ncbi:methyl-accepting chemotaxis protein [Oceanobacillus manasiensis]|uniref:methyl-accepting chemotaxis protein n=1 Tax=Oceanobacillus manasiensis TaxID=586413 RepID=UPI0006939287|nr:HAMP domain-containing methyl-accepting chemotaxis protein [Oceanobacillus manasiensis]